jgi:hypothetical protein
MNRIHFGIFLFGLCLFGTGVGLLVANADNKQPSPMRPVLAKSPAVPTTDPPTTTSSTVKSSQSFTAETTTAKQRAARSETKPLRLVTTTTAAPEIGTATSIVRERNHSPSGRG